MKNGLYVVQFRSQIDQGNGVVVVQDGSVNGGDFGYIYQGKLREESGNNITATIEVTRHNNQAESIFGSAQNFKLLLAGTTEEKSFNLKGNVEGNTNQQIQITGTYLKELA